MRKTTLLIIVTAIVELLLPNVNFAQAPNLGTAANFVLFSGVGAVGNTGISQLTGNIGTNSGAITGFGNVNGVMHNADATTAQALVDLNAAVVYLNMLPPNGVHGPVLGNGETLFKGVDTLAAAGSIVGILTLDAQGDSNAVFIFKIGGALTTAASASVQLINGALACNVFWITKGGAISLAASTIMKGTLIANPGAIDMGDGCMFEGRALSVTGAVTVYGTHASIPTGCGSPVLSGPVTPAMGTASCFALLSANGSVLNSGVTNITGDVGTNNGSTIGYNPLLVTGSVRLVPDASTAQASTDFQNALNYVDTLPYDIELLYPAQFGNELVLTPHIYRMNAAATLTDTLYLDAEGNTNAVFVIQILGALSTATNSNVRLVNGTQAKNVYWEVKGAVVMGTNTVFAGSVLCPNGAITLNTGVLLTGRALTSSGIINTTAITANNSFGGSCSILALNLASFTGACNMQNIVLNWSTSGEAKENNFSIERSDEGINWESVGTVASTKNSSLSRDYNFTDKPLTESTYYYRLKQTGFNGNDVYSTVVMVGSCSSEGSESLSVYPNPTTGKFFMLYTGDKSQVSSIEIFDAQGDRILKTMRFQSRFDLSDKPAGVYFVSVHLHTRTIQRTVVVE